MKKLPFLFLLALAVACKTPRNQQQTAINMDETHLFLLGTYTENTEEGINLIAFDPEQGVMEILEVASDVENPSFVIANTKENLVFAAEETGGEQGGVITSFKLDKTNRTLEKINSVYTQGNSPCHISLDPSERFLIVSNYSGGNVTAVPVDQDGYLSDDIQVIRHEGSSINTDRQEAPHVHSAVFHPSESRVFVGDLGTDKIYMYDLDEKAATPLSPSDPASFSVQAGAGPRHLTFNQEGNRIYLIHELTAEVGVYAYEQGKISHLETHSLVPEDFTGEVGAAEVRISPDGRFLYASNRGEANDITVFAIDGESGQLLQVQNISSQGIAPRNFAITADGKFLICGNQNSDEVVAFYRNNDDGKLTPTGISLSVKKPVYFYFLR